MSEQPGWQRRNLSPGRGLVVIVVLLLIVLNFPLFWEYLSHFIVIILEVGEEFLDIVLEHIGLASGAAQMVTAYIGLGLLIALLMFIAHRARGWVAGFRILLRDYRDMYVYVLQTLWKTGCIEMAAWWSSLDWLGKFLALIALLVVVIPLAIGLSIGMGLLVSLLF